MKRYIRANTEKPTLTDISAEWKELDDGSGITYIVYSGDKTIFEEVFDYQDVDSDAIYDSAIDMAITVLSQTYDLPEDVEQLLKGS